MYNSESRCEDHFVKELVTSSRSQAIPNLGQLDKLFGGSVLLLGSGGGEGGGGEHEHEACSDLGQQNVQDDDPSI